jgi:hypothetical protein
MILIAATAIVGGVCSFALLLPLGWIAALVGAPFGGSIAATALACVIAYRRTRAAPTDAGEALPAAGRLESEARPA